jgi:hypothetical protein
LNSPPPLLSFISPPLIPGTVLIPGIIFYIYIHVYTLFATYSSFYPFPCHLTLPLVPPPASSSRTSFTFLFSNFVEEKNIKDKKRNKVFLLV